MPINLTPTQQVGLQVGGQLLSAGLNYAAQTRNNQMQLKYNREMYERQRRDALSDYNMQNQYNSPQEQMKRYMAAGLNANLIYGQQQQGAQIRSTDAKSYNPTAPQIPNFDITGAIAQTQNLQQMGAQTNLINEKIKTEQLTQQLKQWDAIIAPLEYASKETKNKVSSALADTQIQAGKQGLEKLVQSISIAGQQNERANQLQAGKISIQNAQVDSIIENIAFTKVKETLTNQQIQNLQAVLQQVKTNTELQQLEVDLRKKGFSFHDPYYIRIIGDKTTDLINEGLKRFGDSEVNKKEVKQLLENPRQWNIQPKY